MLGLTLGVAVAAVVFLVYAYLGFKWQRTKSESWLLTMSSIEGRSGESLSAAKTVRGIIRHPRRHLMIGYVLSFLALCLWFIWILDRLT
jgi:multisubunit Na+/H+ antiporter MnhB subunit